MSQECPFFRIACKFAIAAAVSETPSKGHRTCCSTKIYKQMNSQLKRSLVQLFVLLPYDLWPHWMQTRAAVKFKRDNSFSLAYNCVWCTHNNLHNLVHKISNQGAKVEIFSRCGPSGVWWVFDLFGNKFFILCWHWQTCTLHHWQEHARI